MVKCKNKKCKCCGETWVTVRKRPILKLPKSIPFKVGDKVTLTRQTSIGKKGEWAVITDVEFKEAKKNPDWWRGRSYIRILIKNKKDRWDWVSHREIVPNEALAGRHPRSKTLSPR